MRTLCKPVFDELVKAEPAVPVSAGDGLGHMGFYQLPLENGKTSRYQVHIECLSAGDVETFLSNPEHAGAGNSDAVKGAGGERRRRSARPVSDTPGGGMAAGRKRGAGVAVRAG